jgi:hypothetical protein
MMEAVSASETPVSYLPDYTVLHSEDSHLHFATFPQNNDQFHSGQET